MADKTFGVKASDETFEKAQLLIDSSGLTSKEWFERILALYEMNTIKQGSSDYTQDLTELEHHTTRIFELVVNMVQRSDYLKDHAVKEVADKLGSKEAIIIELQQQNNRFKSEHAQKHEEVKILQKEMEQLKREFASNQTILDNNQALIEEYKQKSEILKDLVEQYKGFAEENEQLKNSIEQEKQRTNEEKAETMKNISKLESNLQQAEHSMRELTTDLKNTKESCEREIAILQERKDIEREKAVVDLEREFQTKLQAQNDKYNNKVAELYAENERIRVSYEDKLEKLGKQK